MLNPLPDLLSLSFFAPTILRVVAGLTLVYIARAMMRNIAVLQETPIRFLNWQVRQKKWEIQLLALLTFIAGGALIVGLYTQIAAYYAILSATGELAEGRKHSVFLFVSRGQYLLLIAICISLLLTGAGALAFDLPL